MKSLFKLMAVGIFAALALVGCKKNSSSASSLDGTWSLCQPLNGRASNGFTRLAYVFEGPQWKFAVSSHSSSDCKDKALYSNTDGPFQYKVGKTVGGVTELNLIPDKSHASLTPVYTVFELKGSELHLEISSDDPKHSGKSESQRISKLSKRVFSRE